MKKIRYYLLGGSLYIALSLILSSYGNMVAHPNINQAIVERFQKQFLDGIFTIEKYKNYTIQILIMMQIGTKHILHHTI
ncbi:MAG: hypothetical protein KAH17_05285 [Bacteroidales bacterium]|nr:hypothetical protein [Bacteroidales bacterium]